MSFDGLKKFKLGDLTEITSFLIRILHALALQSFFVFPPERIRRAGGVVLCLLCAPASNFFWQRKIKRTPFPNFRLYPYFPSKVLNYFFTNSEAHTCT